MAAPNIAASTAKIYKKSYAQALGTTMSTLIGNAVGSGLVIEVISAIIASASSSTGGTVNLNQVKSGASAVPLIGAATAITPSATITAIEKSAPVVLEEGDVITGNASVAGIAASVIAVNQYQES